MLQYLEKLQQEDLEELIRKRETQKQLMQDVNKANDVRESNNILILHHPEQNIPLHSTFSFSALYCIIQFKSTKYFLGLKLTPT